MGGDDYQLSDGSPARMLVDYAIKKYSIQNRLLCSCVYGHRSRKEDAILNAFTLGRTPGLRHLKSGHSHRDRSRLLTAIVTDMIGDDIPDQYGSIAARGRPIIVEWERRKAFGGPLSFVSVRVAQNWFKRFQSGKFDVKDEPLSGRPVTDKVDVILDKVDRASARGTAKVDIECIPPSHVLTGYHLDHDADRHPVLGATLGSADLLR
ncbi:hypothetical protein EVAR_98770_1 [Eumeta japonica]|uniref:Mos1 transposase HTH domain-containing protein n=1 Tax=Eumeta variegata TaxID=151549 RepID=A0A4C1YT00_EUMVA|nr:hypothetical protein EVAR_98770_1 [Eumeta japonica]